MKKKLIQSVYKVKGWNILLMRPYCTQCLSFKYNIKTKIKCKKIQSSNQDTNSFILLWNWAKNANNDRKHKSGFVKEETLSNGSNYILSYLALIQSKFESIPPSLGYSILTAYQEEAI